MTATPGPGPCVRMGLLLTLSLLAAAGCRPTDQATKTMDAEARARARAELPPAVRDALDRGSAAFRARQYDSARAAYRDAAARAPDVAAAWFGVYMAERALGNVEAADSALARAREVAPGASLLTDSVP